MARLLARGLILALAVQLSACNAPAQNAAAAQPAPAAAPAPKRPVQVWAFTKLHGTDYVSTRDIARRYGLKAAWTKSDTVMTLSDARGVRFTFEKDQRDFHLDGTRIFLGQLTRFSDDSLWVPKLDVIKTIAPLAAPADHGAFLPAAPKVIVLDPGHGGTDPGTENKKLGVNEKTFALDVAFRLKKLLEAGGYRVLLTRDKDARFSNSPAIDLPLRADFANKAGADLYVSIHFNNAPESVAGVETYVLPPQFMLSTADTKPDELTAVAQPGNRQDVASLLAGYHLHRALRAELKTPDRGYKRARWGVLRPLNCPGVLVECAYLSNEAEARRAATPEFRQKIAEGLAEGVRSYTATLAALRPPSETGNDGQ